MGIVRLHRGEVKPGAGRLDGDRRASLGLRSPWCASAEVPGGQSAA
jgi:hypothetical protein